MLWLSDLEGKAVGEPLIWELNLFAIDEFLTEETIFITDGVAVSWIAKGSDGIEETSGKTA